MTPIASGSFVTDAMVICPCSGKHVIGRRPGGVLEFDPACREVHLKEKRPDLVFGAA